MSSSDASFDSSSDSEAAETEVEYDLEVEVSSNASEQEDTSNDDEPEDAYANEPLADENWLAQYEAERKKEQELEEQLQRRLSGAEEVKEWCHCGKCDLVCLQNISECYCCCELDGCVEALESDMVLQDLPEGTKLTCITQHPGFFPVFLQKWSLRLAADKYRMKSKKKYKQTGSEERFLRSVSYREFTRLVYGFLGNKRNPLPACAYDAIRKAFPCTKDEEFTGFDLEEEDA